MSAIRSSIFVVIFCCLHGTIVGMVNDSYSKDSSETIEIAPIAPNLFTDITPRKNDLSTEIINIRPDDGQNNGVPNGFVLLHCFLKFALSSLYT